MKNLWILATLLVTQAMAGLEADTAYEGKYVEGKGKLYLMTRKAPGREGSFLAVIQDEKSKQLALYVVDPRGQGGNSYVMTPLEAMEDGSIGIHNDDPSLVLTELGEVLRVTLSNSSNKLGFTKSMRFERKARGRAWSDIIEGSYSRGKTREALVISGLSPVEREAQGLFLSGLEGSYLISEQFPGMYTVLARKYLKWGQQVERAPQKIGVFIEVKGRGQFYLVTPNSGSGLLFKAR